MHRGIKRVLKHGYLRPVQSPVTHHFGLQSAFGDIFHFTSRGNGLVCRGRGDEGGTAAGRFISVVHKRGQVKSLRIGLQMKTEELRAASPIRCIVSSRNHRFTSISRRAATPLISYPISFSASRMFTA